VTCSDGSKPKADTVNAYSSRAGPILTDEEIEAKYRYIYDKYSKSSDPGPTINFTFVVLLVMTGLTIVLAIPYFLLRKKGGKGASISMSFAQMLSQSKKKQAGHIN
jgi:iron-regulated transporter 1